MTEIAPSVIIYNLHQARHVLALHRPVTLLSAPGAASYAGCLWWKLLIDAAGAADISFLDCDDAAGRALEALRLGLQGIVLRPQPSFAIVAEIAAARGAIVLDQAPPALDLAQPGALHRLPAWLGG
jgi:DNA-binding NarL/FixJ family response regulator